MCLVEVEGMKNWQASCVQKVADGMVVKTHTPDILNFRKKESVIDSFQSPGHVQEL